MAAHHSINMKFYHDFPLQAATALAHLPEVIALWRRRIHERQELARWSDRDLNDVGLSKTDIVVELEKPFWQA